VGCEECGGKCCVFLARPSNSPDLDRFYKLRGAQIKNGMAYIKIPCILFDEKTGKCKDYENRPETCKRLEVDSGHCKEIQGLVL